MKEWCAGGGRVRLESAARGIADRAADDATEDCIGPDRAHGACLGKRHICLHSMPSLMLVVLGRIIQKENAMETTQATPRTSEAAIFGRILSNAKGIMSSELARYVLTLGFGEEDQARMKDLTERNQAGALAPEEYEELMQFVKAGHLLALLHSKARFGLTRKLL
jgi:hypothetical protein